MPKNTEKNLQLIEMFNLKREKLSLSFCNLSNFHYLCRTNQYQAYETRITFKGIPSLLRWF